MLSLENMINFNSVTAAAGSNHTYTFIEILNREDFQLLMMIDD